MREALLSLVARMTIWEPHVNSDVSISWHAHREAETLTDPSMVDELAEYPKHENIKDHRGAAYFIVGQLGQEVRNDDCASLLLSYVSTEKNKYVLSGLLDALAGVGKPRRLDLSPVFRLLCDDRWLVRHSAIQALERADSVAAEDQLLHVLETTSDKYDIIYCQATLNKVGTAKAIPVIEKSLSSRTRDVKMSAQFAIEAIREREKMSRLP